MSNPTPERPRPTPQTVKPAGASGSFPAIPPGAIPPGAIPPGAIPPGAIPPGAIPPGAMPATPPAPVRIPIPPPGARPQPGQPYGGPSQPNPAPYGQPIQPLPYGATGYGQPTPAPYGQPTPAPYGQPTPAPYGQPTPAPYGQPTPAPFGQPTPAPFGQPTPAPYGQPTGLPFGQSAGLPFGQSAGLPFGRSAPGPAAPASGYGQPGVDPQAGHGQSAPFAPQPVPQPSPIAPVQPSGYGMTPVAESYGLQTGYGQTAAAPPRPEADPLGGIALPENNALPLDEAKRYIRAQIKAGQTPWQITEQLVKSGMTEAAAREAVASVPVETEPSAAVREAIARASYRPERPGVLTQIWQATNGGEVNIAVGVVMLVAAAGATYMSHAHAVGGGNNGVYAVYTGLFGAGAYQIFLGCSKL